MTSLSWANWLVSVVCSLATAAVSRPSSSRAVEQRTLSSVRPTRALKPNSIVTSHDSRFFSGPRIFGSGSVGFRMNSRYSGRFRRSGGTKAATSRGRSIRWPQKASSRSVNSSRRMTPVGSASSTAWMAVRRLKR